jgi:hypothetical protein
VKSLKPRTLGGVVSKVDKGRGLQRLQETCRAGVWLLETFAGYFPVSSPDMSMIAQCLIAQRFKKEFSWESEASKRILITSFSFLKSEIGTKWKESEKKKLSVQKW